MKTLSVSAAVLLIAASCTQNQEFLFNGEDLDGWTIYLEDPNIVPEDFFYVTDGVIETVGVPAGYLRTEKEFSDYHLHLEWRYPEEPTNSGIFIHATGPDKNWPLNFQAQLKYENAGDFIVQGPGLSATINEKVYLATDSADQLVPKMNPTNEKPAGQWNSYDITCSGSTIEIRVNGLLQNTATNCSLTSGGIGLQAEGSRIQYRNIWIKPL